MGTAFELRFLYLILFVIVLGTIDCSIPIGEIQVKNNKKRSSVMVSFTGVTYEPIKLRCKLRPRHFEGEVRWQKLTKDGYINVSRGTLSPTKQTLAFSSPALKDAGIYRCQAMNGETVLATNEMELKLNRSPTFVEGQKRDYRVRSGETAKLTCHLKRNSSAMDVLWTWTPGKWHPLNRNMYSVGKGKVLKLIEVSRAQSGSYLCQVYSEAVLRASRKMTLLVKENVFQPGQQRIYHVNVGQPITLACDLRKKFQKGVFHWTFSPGLDLLFRTREIKPKSSSNKLTIPCATRKHEGQYWCVTKTKEGKTSRWMTLVVSGNPSFAPGQLIHYSACMNEEKQMTCSLIPGMKVDYFIWLKIRAPENRVNPHTPLFTADSRLDIAETGEEDNGEYLCAVKTPSGVAARWMTMKVSDCSPSSEVPGKHD